MQRNAPLFRRAIASLVVASGTTLVSSSCLPPPAPEGPLTGIGDSLMLGYPLDGATKFANTGDSADVVLQKLRSNPTERSHIASSAVVIVSAGTNTGRRPYEDVMSDIINEIYALNSDVRLILVPLYARSSRVHTDAYNDVLRRLSESHRAYGRGVYVAEWLSPAFRPANCLKRDLVHPTPGCYRELGNRLMITAYPPTPPAR